MKIIVSKRENAKLKAFNKKEWPLADAEHFGKNLDWSPIHHILTAYDKAGTVTGALEMKVEVGVAYIDTLIVAKGHRGEGIGSALMKRAEKIARQDNAHKIHLVTGKSWHSVKFYEKLGYKITSELRNHYFHQDFVELTKFL